MELTARMRSRWLGQWFYRRIHWIYLFPYLLVMLAISTALNPIWLQHFPSLQLYSGTLSFSGERAYAALRSLATGFPHRVAGSAGDRHAADWVAAQFRQMGLDTHLEIFETFVPESLWKDNLLTAPVNQTHHHFSGANVVALSRGRSSEVVLFMAHRDEVPGAIQGSDDNASGNAVLLELARTLAGQDHLYTYWFVSTDAEESGFQGAADLAANHPDLELRLVLSLDEVGYDRANTLGLYNYGNARQSAPLWTVALAHAVLKEQGLQSDYLNSYRFWPGNSYYASPFSLLCSLLSQRGLGTRSATDSEVFLERGTPTLGLEAVELPPSDFIRPLSAFWDPAQPILMDHLSPSTLEMAGRFVEQYVRSLEINRFNEPLTNRLYVVWADTFLPPDSVLWCVVLVLVALAVLVVCPFVTLPFDARQMLNYLRRDGHWLDWIFLVALTGALVWELPQFSLFQGLPLGIFILMTVLILVVGGLVIYRRRTYSLRLWHFEPAMIYQHRLLVILLLGFYLFYSLLFSPFTAAAMLFLPFFVWSVARFHSRWNRAVWATIFIFWTALHGLFSVMALYTADSHTPPWTWTGLLTWMLNGLVWLVVLIYVFSTPPVGVIERR